MMWCMLMQLRFLLILNGDMRFFMGLSDETDGMMKSIEKALIGV